MGNGLIEWEEKHPDGSGRRLEVMGVPTMAIAASAIIGAVAFIGGGPVVVMGGPGSKPPEITYAAPSAPTIDVVVDDTTTWRMTFSEFSGDGDDTQDSISVTVLRSGTTDTLFHAVSGVQSADTIVANDSLKADSAYVALGRQKGVNGGWSAYDSVAVTNTVASASYLWACNFGTIGSTEAAITDCGGSEQDFRYFGATPDGTAVLASDDEDLACDWSVTGVATVLQQEMQGADGEGLRLYPGDVTALDSLEVGEWRYWRWYTCRPHAANHTNHNTYLGPKTSNTSYNGQSFISPNWEGGSGGTYRAAVKFTDSASQAGDPWNAPTGWEVWAPQTPSGDMTIGDVYLWQMAVHRTAIGDVRLYIKVDDMTNDEEDFLTSADFDNDYFGPGTTTLADSTDLSFDDYDVERIHGLEGFGHYVDGSDGIGGTYVLEEIAAICVADGTGPGQWIGDEACGS